MLHNFIETNFMFGQENYYNHNKLRSRFSPDLNFLRSIDLQDKLSLDDSLLEQEAYMTELFEDEVLNSKLGDVYKAVKVNEVVNRLFAMAGIRSVDLIQLGEEIDKLKKIIAIGEYIDTNGIRQSIPVEEAKEAERLALDLYNRVKSEGFDQTSLKFRFNSKAPVVSGSSMNNHFNNIVGLLEEAKRDNKSINMAFFGVTSPELVDMIVSTADATGMQGKIKVRTNETYGTIGEDRGDGLRHQASIDILESKLGQNLMATGPNTMHAKFMSIGLDGEHNKASFFIGSPNLTRAAMSMTRPVSHNIESGFIFNKDYFDRNYIGSEDRDTAFGRIMNSARAASNELFNTKHISPFSDIRPGYTHKSGVVTGRDLIEANHQLLDKATRLVKAGETVKVTLTTFNMSELVDDAYNRRIRDLVEAGGTVEIIIGRKTGRSVESKIESGITNALKSGHDRLLVRSYQHGIIHAKRTVVTSQTPDGDRRVIASLEESGNKNQLYDTSTVNVGMLLLGSEFDLENESRELEFLSRGIQTLGTSTIWDQGMDAVAKGTYSALTSRMQSEMSDIDMGSIRLKGSGEGDRGFVTLEMYQGKHKLAAFNFGRMTGDGRLYSKTFNKFITPVNGAISVKDLNKLTKDARKNLDFEFDEYQVIAAAVGGMNKVMNTFIKTLEAQMNLSYNEIMRDAYLRSYIKIIANKEITKMFENFASPEEGLTNYTAKQHSARLVFSQQDGILDLYNNPKIDPLNIQESLDLLEAIKEGRDLGNMTGYLVSDKPFIYRAGGMSKFRSRKGSTSAARIFSLDDFINYLPIGSKQDDDYMFMLPLNKAFQLVGRLGNIMSARALDLSQMSSHTGGRELKGQSLFKAADPSAVAREGLRLQGYMVLGMTGDVGYLKGSYWDGEYVSRDSVYTQTWLSSRVSPIQLGEFKTRLMDLPETFEKLKDLAIKAGIDKYAGASVTRVGSQLALNQDAINLIKDLHHMSPDTRRKLFKDKTNLLKSLMPGMRVFYDNFLAIEEIKTKASRMVTSQILGIDLDSLRVEKTDKGSWSMTVGTKVLENLGSGMRFIANVKAPINVHGGDSDLFNALDSLDPETNLFKGPANVVLSSRLFKSGDMLMQTGIEVIKNQQYADQLIGKFNIGNKAERLASLRGLFNRLGLSDFYGDLASDNIDLSTSIASVRSKLSGKAAGISLKDKKAAALTALMFVLHAESDIEIYTKKLEASSDSRRTLGKYQASTLDESLMENLGMLGVVRVAGYATLAANNTPISARPTISMLGYFMDDVSHALRRSVGRDNRTLDSTVDGLAALLGYKTRDSIVIGRSMQELQGFSLSNARDLTAIALEDAKQLDSLSMVDLIRGTRSMAGAVARIKQSTYLTSQELIETGDVGLLKKYLEAQKKIGIKSRTLYIPKLGQTESGRWIGYDLMRDVAKRKQQGTDFIAIRMLDPNTLLNYAIYDNYASEVARLQVQIESMMPDVNRMFWKMGDMTMIRPDLSPEESGTIDKFMNIVIRLQEAQNQLMSTDNQKYMGGEIRGSGYNLIPVAEPNVFFRENGLIRRDMVVLGDEVYEQELTKLKGSIRRDVRSKVSTYLRAFRKLGKPLTDAIDEMADGLDKDLLKELYKDTDVSEVLRDYFSNLGLEDIGDAVGKHYRSIAKAKAARYQVISSRERRIAKLHESNDYKKLRMLEGRVTNNFNVIGSLRDDYDSNNSSSGDIEQLRNTRKKIKDISKNFRINLTKAKQQRKFINEKYKLNEIADDISMLNKYIDIKEDYILSSVIKSLPEGANQEAVLAMVRQAYTDPMVRSQIVQAMKTNQANRASIIEAHVDKLTASLVNEMGGLPMVFFRAGAPVGAPGMVTVKAISGSEYIEKYEGASSKAGNTHSLIINPDLMSIFFGDTDGDSASIALMNKYVDLMLKNKSGLLSPVEVAMYEKMDMIVNTSYEEKFIEHAYRTSGMTIRDNDLNPKVNSLIHLYFGDKGDVNGIGIQARMLEIQALMKRQKKGTIDSKGTVELEAFDARLQEHYAIAQKINSFANDLYEAAEKISSVMAGRYMDEDQAKHIRETEVPNQIKKALLKQYSLFGGEAGGMTKLSSNDIDMIMQAVSISATKMIGLTFNTVDNINRQVNREVARASYKLYEELVSRDSDYIGLDPKDAFMVIEKEFKNQIDLDDYNQVKDYHNFYTGVNQLIQQAVRDAIKPKGEEDMRRALDTMNESGVGAFLVGGDVNAGAFVDALHTVVNGRGMGLTGESENVDLSDMDTLRALQGKFVDNLTAYINNYNSAMSDQAVLDFIGGEQKIKNNTREVANALFMSLVLGDTGTYEKNIKSYAKAANSGVHKFYEIANDISLEDKLLMYEQLTSRGKFVNPNGLRLATEDLVFGLSNEVDVKAKVLRDTGNANLAEVLQRLVVLNKINATRVDMADEMSKSNIQNDMYLKASRMQTLEKSLGLNSEYSQDKLREQRASLLSWEIEEYAKASDKEEAERANSLDEDNKIRYRQNLELERLLHLQERYQATDPYFESFKAAGQIDLGAANNPLRASQYSVRKRMIESATHGTVSRAINDGVIPSFTAMGMMIGMGINDENQLAEAAGAGVGGSIAFAINPIGSAKAMLSADREQMAETGAVMVSSTVAGLAAYKGLDHVLNNKTNRLVTNLISSIGSATVGIVAALVSSKLANMSHKTSKPNSYSDASYSDPVDQDFEELPEEDFGAAQEEKLQPEMGYSFDGESYTEINSVIQGIWGYQD